MSKELYVYEIEFIPKKEEEGDPLDITTGLRMSMPLPRVVADTVSQTDTNICYWKEGVLQLCLNPQAIRYARNIGTAAEVEERDRQVREIQEMTAFPRRKLSEMLPDENVKADFVY